MRGCPGCGEQIAEDAGVCRHCLHVIDRAGWGKHDAGRLGADNRGGGKPLEDPPVGPIPLDAGPGGGAAGALAAGLRLLTATLLAGSRRVRGR